MFLTTVKINGITVPLIFQPYGHKGGTNREMTQEIATRFIGICAVLFVIFGIPYAILIGLRPFRPGLTWLSVLIGDLMTDFGTGAQLLLFTGDPVLASLPLLNHILTGGPMILGQILKHRLQNGGHIIIEDEDGDAA